jgi:hypothetical protein
MDPPSSGNKVFVWLPDLQKLSNASSVDIILQNSLYTIHFLHPSHLYVTHCIPLPFTWQVHLEVLQVVLEIHL